MSTIDAIAVKRTGVIRPEAAGGEQRWYLGQLRNDAAEIPRKYFYL